MDFIYNYLSLLYSFYIDSSLQDLKVVDEQKISDFFAALLIPGHSNYFEIYLENGALKERLATPEDINQAIDEDSEDDSNLTVSPNQSKTKKNKKKKIKQKKIFENKDSDMKENPKGNEQQPSASNNNIIDIENINEIQDVKQKMKILVDNIIDLKKSLKEKDEKIDNLQAIFVEENKIRDNNIYKLEKELSEVKSDLKLIKSHDALKVFMDLFYKGADFTEY